MLDLLLRGGAIGTVTVTALVLLAGGRDRQQAASVACFGLLIGCYLIVSGPDAAGLPVALDWGLTQGAILAPLGFTWMMLELLSSPQQRRLPWLALAALVVVAAEITLALSATTSGGEPLAWAGQVRGALAVALFAGLMVMAVQSDRDDLVPARRRFRRGFLAAMTALGVTITLFELSGADRNLPYVVYPVQAGAFWVLGLLFALQALEPGGGLIPPARTLPAPPRQPEAPAPVRSDLIDRLEAAMAQGSWRREGLTIGALADDLGVPEHRLRVAINRELGHRNFSTFINTHRIDAARAMLTDPARADVTILEIAYDTGFASLGPFNKAFRAQTGQSPREFRTGGPGAG